MGGKTIELFENTASAVTFLLVYFLLEGFVIVGVIHKGPFIHLFSKLSHMKSAI